MSAFFIATVKIKNPEKFQLYAQQAQATFTPFEGEVLMKGKYIGNFAGTGDHQSTAIVRFPSLENMDSWYESEAYQNIIPLRDEAAEMTIVKYAVPEK